MKRKTTDEFILDAQKVHKDKYNYSLVDYINTKTNVKIICNIHGEFEQLPANHLIGKGCYKCGRITTTKKKSLSTDEFIIRSKKIHNNKYDYNLVKYINNKTKVKIICPEHGLFEQIPNYHINNGSGCPKCKFEKIAKLYSRSNNDFLLQAKKIHGNIYDYSLVNYKNDITKVKLICLIHGEFEQTPNKHLKGRGCQKCGGTSLKTTEQFIIDAKKIHNKKYDYKLVNYKGNRIKIKIICNEHGIFNIIPVKHLIGRGCPKCRETIGETKVRTLLENNNISYEIQKTFDGCIYEKSLKFDFYLPDKNIAIEFDGIQHFEPIEWFGGEKRFKIQQKIDLIKTNYCKDNNIKLIRISYLENVDIKLNAFF